VKLGAIGGNLSKTPKKWLKNSKKRAFLPVFLVEIRGFEPVISRQSGQISAQSA